MIIWCFLYDGRNTGPNWGYWSLTFSSNSFSNRKMAIKTTGQLRISIFVWWSVYLLVQKGGGQNCTNVQTLWVSCVTLTVCVHAQQRWRRTLTGMNVNCQQFSLRKFLVFYVLKLSGCFFILWMRRKVGGGGGWKAAIGSFIKWLNHYIRC